MGNNQLTGPIPDAFDGKSRLHGLSLSNNKLSGARICQRHTHAVAPPSLPLAVDRRLQILSQQLVG